MTTCTPIKSRVAKYVVCPEWTGGIISSEQNRLIRYYCYDGLGTVTGLTDAYGLLVQSYQYDAYGNILKQTGLAHINSYQFSTKEYDSKSGLSYFGRRYYDSTVGRWITKDPAGMFNGMHLYLYCHNNPINRIDPWGLMAIILDPYRLENYAPVGEIAKIVNEAISKSSIWEAYLGQAGRNIDQTKRYIYTERLQWIDLQHVVSTAYAPHAEYYIYATLGGLVFESLQGIKGYLLNERETLESAFRTEDIISNVLGGVAANIAKERNISIGEMIAIMIKNAKPYNPETK